MLGNIIGGAAVGAFSGLTDSFGLNNKSSDSASESNQFEGSGIGDTFEQLLSQIADQVSGSDSASESDSGSESSGGGLEGQMGAFLEALGQLLMALAPMLEQMASESGGDDTSSATA